jgi:hypothetical protein
MSYEAGRCRAVGMFCEARGVSSTKRLTPKRQVASACEQLGESEVVRWASGLAEGSIPYDDPDWPSLTLLVGAGAVWALSREDLEASGPYWPRVWGMRALLYAWRSVAAPAVLAGLRDDAWRVREMAAKVVRLRELGEAADPLIALLTDPVPRVRLAAVQALERVGEGEHAAAVARAADDEDAKVRQAIERALAVLADRLDRPIDDLIADWD